MVTAPWPIFVGVDPAFRDGGFWVAIVDRTDNTVKNLKFSDVLEYHDWLRTESAPLVAFVIIEASDAQNFNFARSRIGNRGELMAKSRDIGKNQAVSALAFRSSVRKYGDRFVFKITPEEKGVKITDDRFILGILAQEGLTADRVDFNQDQRDAIKIALILERQVKQKGLLQVRPAAEHYAND